MEIGMFVQVALTVCAAVLVGIFVELRGLRQQTKALHELIRLGR
jgi:hypothetical protein